MPLSISKVCILGLGQFGFALAKLVGDLHPGIQVVGFDLSKDYVNAVIESRTHPVFHKGIVLPKNVTATHDCSEAVKGSQLAVLAVPGQYIRSLIKQILPFIDNDIILLNVSKALEDGTNKCLSTVVSEEMKGCPYKYYFAALSGGMIAEEVTRDCPIGADIACEDEETGKLLKTIFRSRTFRIEVSTDVLGVELAGALKNVVAIGSGFFDGLGLDTSSKAAYVSAISKEMRELAITLGGQKETFEIGGNAWAGDLLTTCFGKSRNRYFGELIGKGNSVSKALNILESEKKRSEGYLTTKSFHLIAHEKGLRTPLLDILYSVLFEDENVSTAVFKMFE